MSRRVGCLHAHYSNIIYIEAAFAKYNIELIHVVNPVLLEQLSHDNSSLIKEKLKNEVDALFSIRVEAVIITCSTYSGLYDYKDELTVIKIDDPFIHYLNSQNREINLLFTNPLAIALAKSRMSKFINETEKSIHYTVIPNSFHLIMSGKQDEYNHAICLYLEQLISNNNNDSLIAVAQLSMVYAANKIASHHSVEIANPLDYLVIEVLHKLNIT